MKGIFISYTITFRRFSGARNDSPLNEDLNLFPPPFEFDSNGRSAPAAEVFILIPLLQDQKQLLPYGNRLLTMGTIEGSGLELIVAVCGISFETRQV